MACERRCGVPSRQPWAQVRFLCLASQALHPMKLGGTVASQDICAPTSLVADCPVHGHSHHEAVLDKPEIMMLFVNLLLQPNSTYFCEYTESISISWDHDSLSHYKFKCYVAFLSKKKPCLYWCVNIISFPRGFKAVYSIKLIYIWTKIEKKKLFKRRRNLKGKGDMNRN